MTRDRLRFPALEAARWLAVALAVAFLYGISAQGRESRADFSAVAEAVSGAAALEGVQEADNQMVKRLYGLNPGDYDGVLLYYPTTNMGAEELLLVKLKDVSQQETVSAAVAARLKAQRASFEGYGVDQYDMLQRSVTELRGNYVLLVVAADPAPVRDAFLDAL